MLSRSAAAANELMAEGSPSRRVSHWLNFFLINAMICINFQLGFRWHFQDPRVLIEARRQKMIGKEGYQYYRTRARER